jgi:hypothetical protein
VFAVTALASVKYLFDEPSERSSVSWFESEETVPVTSPTRSAVISPAAKLPEPSRFTTLFASFADVAVPPIRLTI